MSKIADFTTQNFMEVIDDAVVKAEDAGRVILCTGKVYYDLLEHREQHQLNDTAIVRVEQLYPVPHEKLQAIKAKYNKATDWVWVQEEPENMGAWPFILRVLKDYNLRVVARPESASPATGSPAKHEKQHKRLLENVFGSVLA